MGKGSRETWVVVIMLIVAGEAMVSKDARPKCKKNRNLRNFHATAYAPLVAAFSAACSAACSSSYPSVFMSFKPSSSSSSSVRS